MNETWKDKCHYFTRVKMSNNRVHWSTIKSLDKTGCTITSSMQSQQWKGLGGSPPPLGGNYCPLGGSLPLERHKLTIDGLAYGQEATWEKSRVLRRRHLEFLEGNSAWSHDLIVTWPHHMTSYESQWRHLVNVILFMLRSSFSWLCLCLGRVSTPCTSSATEKSSLVL